MDITRKAALGSWGRRLGLSLTLGLATTFGTSHIVVQERAPDPVRGS